MFFFFDKENKDINSKYLVFDVETANDDKSSICQIGMVFLDENFQELEDCRFETLIDPKDEFEYYYHTRIHHIDQSVIDKYNPDTFDIFWNKYKDCFYNNTLVFHANSNFDINAIKAALEKYSIPFEENSFSFIDTQKWITNLTNCELKPYKVNLLCGRLGYPVSVHHDALNDAMMCSYIFKWLNDNDPNKERLSSKNGGNLKSHHSINKQLSEEQIKLSEFFNYLGAIIEDDQIDEDEYNNLKNVIDDYSILEGLYPYDKAKELLDEIITLDDSNKNEIFNRILCIIDIKCSENFFEPEDIAIDFEGKTFRLTNEFHDITRDSITKEIESLGGVVNSSAKADYLIIGGIINYSNKFILYNDKMIKAYENKVYKNKGNKIIGEVTLKNNMEKYHD